MLKVATIREFDSNRRSRRAPARGRYEKSPNGSPSSSPTAAAAAKGGTASSRGFAAARERGGHTSHSHGLSHGAHSHVHHHHSQYKPKWATRVTPLTQEEKDELEVAKTPGLLAPMSISPDNPEEFENLGSMRTRFSPALVYNLLRNFEDAPRVFKNIAHCDVDPLEEPGTFRVTQHVKWRFLFLSGTFATTLICQRNDGARSSPLTACCPMASLIFVSLLHHFTLTRAEPGFMKAFKGGWTIHDLSPPKPLPLAPPSTPPSKVALKPSFLQSLAAALPGAAATAAETATPSGVAEGAGSGMPPSGSLIEMWQLSQPAMVPPRPLSPLAGKTQARLSSSQSELAGLSQGLANMSVSRSSAQPAVSRVVTPVAKRVCDLTGKRRNNGYSVSFSNHRTKKVQQPNLQYKRVWWEEGQRYVRLKLSTKAIKTLEWKGLDKMAKEAGIDLSKF
ncbi:unnamed protein product [Closterium sp. NIES-64]|nr:unnamed protein product [Closterium sp. NIES-64]